MKKPPTPKQIIEGKEPNELTDLLEMEAPKEPLEKAWEDLKEATEKWNKEALKAMDTWETSKGETPTENINETNQSVVIGENITTKENWREEFEVFYSPIDDSRNGNICITLPSKSSIESFIEKTLLTQRKEIVEIAREISWDESGMGGNVLSLTDLSHRIEERYKHNN